MIQRNVARRLAPWGFVVSAVAGLSACIALVDTSGLSGGPGEPPASPEPGAPDDPPTNPPPADGSPAEDASPADSTIAGDLPDAPCDDVDPGARTFCSQYNYDWGYTYCRDFDDDSPILFGWEGRKLDTGGSIARDECHRHSAPGALRSRIEANAASCSNAVVSQTIGVRSSFRVAFSVRLRHVSPDASWFTVRLGGDGCDLVFSGDGSSAKVREESGTTVDHPLQLRFPLPDTWTRVWVDVDRTKQTLDVQLDRNPTMSTPAKLGPQCQTTGEITIDFGLQCASPGGMPDAVLYDSVVITD